MRLVTFEDSAGPRVGALVANGDRVIDISAVDPELPTGVVELLRGGQPALARAAAAVSAAGAEHALPRASVRLHAPVPAPGKIVCIGYNYRGHGDEQAIPEFPDVFAKTQNTIIGPDDDIRLPANSAEVDYEGELGVIIGARASNVAVADALNFVGGYTVFNDVSARDFQRRGTQWVLGKSFDTFGPMGPALVTADEIADPQALDITVESHGTVTVTSTTANMIFPVAFLVSYLSEVMTLEPGDIIATGTPGKIPEISALGRFMQPDDTISITYGAVGTLTNRVAGPH